jgi:tripartite-type tricarboxylate transporter receptor subunit TctC
MFMSQLLQSVFQRLLPAATACAVLALSTLVVSAPMPARAQDAAYPSRIITLVVPFPAGSGTDMSARLLAKDMTTSDRKSVV